jgi:predicted nucleic acid-binding protein
VIKAVLDTNTAISGIFWKGPPRKIFEAARERKVLLFSTRPMEEELAPILAEMRSICAPAEETSKDSPVKEDPTDNIFIRCALGAGARFIVSGDRHLLGLGEYKGVRILRARPFLEVLESS